jgi:hypothetical protein
MAGAKNRRVKETFERASVKVGAARQATRVPGSDAKLKSGFVPMRETTKKISGEVSASVMTI